MSAQSDDCSNRFGNEPLDDRSILSVSIRLVFDLSPLIFSIHFLLLSLSSLRCRLIGVGVSVSGEKSEKGQSERESREDDTRHAQLQRDKTILGLREERTTREGEEKEQHDAFDRACRQWAIVGA